MQAQGEHMAGLDWARRLPARQRRQLLPGQRGSRLAQGHRAMAEVWGWLLAPA